MREMNGVQQTIALSRRETVNCDDDDVLGCAGLVLSMVMWNRLPLARRNLIRLRIRGTR